MPFQNMHIILKCTSRVLKELQYISTKCPISAVVDLLLCWERGIPVWQMVEVFPMRDHLSQSCRLYAPFLCAECGHCCLQRSDLCLLDAESCSNKLNLPCFWHPFVEQILSAFLAAMICKCIILLMSMCFILRLDKVLSQYVALTIKVST